MPLSVPTILSSDLNPGDNSAESNSGLSPRPRGPYRKLINLIILGLVVIILIVIGFWLVNKYQLFGLSSRVNSNTNVKIIVPTSSTPLALPTLNSSATSTTLATSSTFSNLKIEYLTFANFYKLSSNKITPNINNYSLPLNVKVDVMNYYDISRKLNLDPGLHSLNNYGFAVINNPWPKQASDFYTLYHNLKTNQIPLLITSDFIIYNYQNVLKKSFKDIEKNVFYNNLWDINKKLYTTARNRYEARLAKIGEVNDSVLEGERLETAFFAVALELLKPQPSQISSSQTSINSKLFSKAEADQFYFVVPSYLQDDVLAEEKLIRQASAIQVKSPVLLYTQDYRKFVVPADYRTNAKLNNFYLTTKWLNSVFPINYKSPNCQNCLLDKPDWRINLIAASLISQDFSLSPELKNKWARIYKVMAFFKGLREDLSYVNYSNSLHSVFGNNYNIEKLFDDQNKQATFNLEKLRTKLLSYSFPAISGGLNRNNSLSKPLVGFRVLAESYRPNNYIFSQLTVPEVSTYLGTTTAKNNISACFDRHSNSLVRCNGIALDLVNLVHPISENTYFSNNTNYLHYSQKIANIQAEMVKSNIWHLNNYWTNLSLIRALLSPAASLSPTFTQSLAWRNQELKTAVAAWINSQLPLENFSVAPVFTGTNINSSTQLDRNSYVEPNLKLINELIANDNMLLGMFSALQLNREVPSALENIKNFSASLIALRKIVIKELSSQALSSADNETILDFTRQFRLNNYSADSQQLHLNFSPLSTGIRENIGHLQLLVLTHQEANNKIFSVGPVWNYQESRW